jgi:hypothetical protein
MRYNNGAGCDAWRKKGGDLCRTIRVIVSTSNAVGRDPEEIRQRFGRNAV